MINICGGRSWERLGGISHTCLHNFLLGIIITRFIFDKSYNTFYKYQIIYTLHFCKVKLISEGVFFDLEAITRISLNPGDLTPRY